MNLSLGKSKTKMIKVLLDSGASSSLIKKALTTKLRHKKSPPVRWKTAAGHFETSSKCDVEFALKELQEKRLIKSSFHVVNNDMSQYDMILGRDILSHLQIDLEFSTNSIVWDSAKVPFRHSDSTAADAYSIKDSSSVRTAANRIKDILDAKYEPANLHEVAESCSHLSENEKTLLEQCLRRHETLFDGSLGKWTGDPYHIQLQKDATPYHARPYPVPQIHEQTLKDEVARLCQVGVLKKVNRSEWAAPSFIIPKKDGTVRFINDFRELNKRIRRMPYPIPKIQDLLQKLEGFQYATSLDLNMAYYHIELDLASKELCTVVFPWGKYELQRLPMGLCNSPDIFQEKMSTLFADLQFVRAYIDDLLVITKGSYEDHLEQLNTVLQRLKDAGLKVNAKKSFFARGELEYLGYWITRTGIQPIPKKVEAIQNIAPPKTKRQLRRFIGMINYYRDISLRRSHILAPLTALTSANAKFQWKQVHQDAFDTIKKALSRHTILAYPDFSQPFDIHTDASKTQLGSVISQNGTPIAFYSRKLNPAQTRYTTTERELLAIVETLKEFKNILLGHPIRVYTDHLNLTFKNFTTDRVMRWRLIVEEFGPEFHYIKGEKNIVADALSRLDMVNTPLWNSTTRFSDVHIAEAFGLNDDDPQLTAFMPVEYKLIHEHQNAMPELVQKALTYENHHLKTFHGGGTSYDLVCHHDKIIIPKSLQKKVVTWYHTLLCHPGETRTEQTLRQHFTWKNLRETVHKHCKACRTCQLNKRKTKKYGHLPAKVAEANPWETLCVDLIGPYTIQRPKKKRGSKKQEEPTLTLWCLTMIDPATGWLEIREIKSKDAPNIANLVEQTWLTRYPWPNTLIYDKGTEFMAEFAKMVREDYGIKRKGITTRNPQANAIIERAHQTIGNIIRTFEMYKDYDILEEHPDDPWSGVLSAAMFAMRATFHTTTQATPSQLVFGRDAILNTKFEADWNVIRNRKQKLIDYNNTRENAKRLKHTYKVQDKVLLERVKKTKYGEPEYDGPYTITEVSTTGAYVRIQKGAYTESVNVRKIHPFQDPDHP